MVSSLAAQTANEGAAKVVRIKGPARFTTGNNVWQPLKVGAVLSPGTVVQTSTESGSYVDLVVGDGKAALPSASKYAPYIPNSMNPASASATGASGTGSAAEQDVIRVFENTALGIDKLSAVHTGADQVTDTQLDLKTGRIAGTVRKMSPASKFEIKLPNGVAGIRGTVFDVTSDGFVRVLVGSMVLAWVDSKSGNVTTQAIMSGQQYDARTAQASPIPGTEMSAFESLIASMRGTTTVMPSTYVADRTVINVSPVLGK
jgi:hypothetical protein